MTGECPPHLPLQEDVKDTYMDPQYIPDGDYTVAQINQGSLESHVCEAWVFILRDIFSIYEGFRVDHVADTQGRRIHMEVCRMKNHRRLNFLALVLKRHSSSNSDQALEDAETQLKRHLESLGNTQKGRLWGASCIGKHVQFYQCSKESGKAELLALHDDMLRIDRQPQTLEQQDLINMPANGLFISDLRSPFIEEYRKGCTAGLTVGTSMRNPMATLARQCPRVASNISLGIAPIVVICLLVLDLSYVLNSCSPIIANFSSGIETFSNI